MCGICGVYGREDKDLLRDMTDILTHRGPDSAGHHVDDGIMLGARRLAIIDIEGGDQPIYNEDGDVCVVFNGAIYNYRELREELEEEGHTFATDSDTEVIPHAYEEWGTDFLPRLDGMFAIALWDVSEEWLLLARDRHGIKPLLYTATDDGDLAFASEAKALLLHPSVEPEMDEESLHLFLNLRYLPQEKTMFRGIRKLLPGHYLVRDRDGIRTGRFWEPDFSVEERPERYYVERIRDLLDKAVESHLVADVPVGIYLSGGLDSSAVAALAAKHSEEPVKALTMGFGEENDEIEAARRTANHLGLDHETLIVEDDLLDAYRDAIWHADAPKRNLYPYYVTKLAADHRKVMLTGLGGDELFAGYPWKHRTVDYAQRMRRRTDTEERRIARRSASDLIRLQAAEGDLADDEHLEYLKKIRNLEGDVDLYLQTQSLDEALLDEERGRAYGPALDDYSYDDVRARFTRYFEEGADSHSSVLRADSSAKLPDDFLFVDDAMSMANSVEHRVPMLDNDLVALARKIPPRMKWRDGTGKRIYRKAVKPLVPDHVLQGEKAGFGSSVTETYRKELREAAEQKVADGFLVNNGYVKERYVEKVLDHPVDSSLKKHYAALWNMYAVEVWHDLYIRGDIPKCAPGGAI